MTPFCVNHFLHKHRLTLKEGDRARVSERETGEKKKRKTDRNKTEMKTEIRKYKRVASTFLESPTNELIINSFHFWNVSKKRRRKNNNNNEERRNRMYVKSEKSIIFFCFYFFICCVVFSVSFLFLFYFFEKRHEHLLVRSLILVNT